MCKKRQTTGAKSGKKRLLPFGVWLSRKHFKTHSLTYVTTSCFRGYVNTDYLLSLSLEEADKEQEKLYRNEGQKCWAANTDPVSEALDLGQEREPWFLSCNPERFPYWFGKPDPRNKELIEAMKAVKESIDFGKESFYSHLLGQVRSPLMS